MARAEKMPASCRTPFVALLAACHRSKPRGSGTKNCCGTGHEREDDSAAAGPGNIFFRVRYCCIERDVRLPAAASPVRASKPAGLNRLDPLRPRRYGSRRLAIFARPLLGFAHVFSLASVTAQQAVEIKCDQYFRLPRMCWSGGSG